MSSSNTLNIALATYQNKQEYNPSDTPENQRRYFKQRSGEWIDLIGSHKYVLGLDTSITSMIFTSKIGKIGFLNINVIGDEELSENVEGPLVCLGSPTSNNLSHRALESFPNDER